MFNFMDRYKLWNVAAFKDDGGGGGDSGGGGGSDDKPAAKNTIGQVSKTGQYAGDGFEWVDSGSGYLTRTYTGAGSDNNLGQDVIAGGTADKNVKEAIATVSLNEGSQFAGTQASVTDYDALDIFRSQENQTASSSFAEQAGVDNYEPSIVYGDDAPAAQAMEEEQSFGEAFAEARAAGQDTFTYDGGLFTTDLAPSTPAPSAPTVSYDAFGNEYSTPQAAAEADQTMAQQAATANDIVRGTEESLFEQPVVSESAQEYLDSLGTDFDFGQFGPDADDPRGDQIVSPTGTGIGQPEFTYVPQANTYAESLQEIADQSMAGAIGADEASALLGLGAGQPLTDTEVAAIMAPEIPVGQVDTSAKDADMSIGVSPSGPDIVYPGLTEDAVTFSGNIYGTDSPYREALQQQILQNAITPAVTDAEGRRRRADRVTTPGTSDSTAGRLLARGVGTGAKVLGSGIEALGELLSPTTARIGYDVGEVDRGLAEAAGVSRGATAMKTGAEKGGVAQFGRDLAETGAMLEDRIEGGLPQATQEALVAPIVGTEISALGRPGLTLDVDALKAQTLTSIPATLAGLSGFALGPVGAGVTGAAMTGGEVGYEAGAEVENEALRRGFSEDEAEAMRIEAQRTGALLGAPAGAISNILFGRVIPGQGKSVIAQTAKNIGEEAFSEGYVEQNIAGLASDPLLGRQTAGTRFSPNEAIIGGLVGGAVTPVLSATQAPAAAPAVDTQTYTPPAATTGQVAQTPVGLQTAYEEAAGIGGPGSDAFPDKMTAAESIMIQQLEDTGAIDVADLQDMGLTLFEVNEAAERAISSKMDSDNQMLQALADQSVLDTGGISEELVEEINDKLGPEAGAQVVDNAINRPFVSNEGKTRMDIMLENAAKAGEESVSTKPATGIETALGTATEETTDVPTDETTEVPTDETTEVPTETTVNIPVDTVVADDDDEVEVEVDDDTTTTTPTTTTTTDDDDGVDIFVPPVTTTDDDGNTITECPEGYEMVETADGPMCQKITTAQRQRAGRGVQAYTGIVTRPGERGPGQRRITTTRTERVRPTTRSA